uniref:Sortilin N-terminal domain-containing protein n=1 Tax=Knipowitschia caucasica TaxID=637954 RepID=A0AAV2LPY8_KNICA
MGIGCQQEISKSIMLLTDPEVESSLLISSDEGATYQKYRLNFYILSLLFHPEQEDWILAYSHDQKVSEQLLSVWSGV